MSEYIGARISLISKSDIRYVGTLHEINSENSTVALENVTSFGTEGRRNGEDEIAASDNIYEYIVFRGSDVKDLRIEDKVEAPKPAPPPMPDDPAILGAARPPQSTPQNPQTQSQPQPPNFPQPFNPPYPTSGPGPYPPFQNQRFGPPPGGYPGGPGGPGFPGYPGMPYGAPPGWYPPPGQGFPPGPPGPFSPHPSQMPIGPQGPKPGQQPGPIGPATNKDVQQMPVEADAAPKVPDAQAKSKSSTPPPARAPTPPVESKPDPAAALAPAQPATAPAAPPAGPKAAPTGPRNNGRIVPAIPLTTPGQKHVAPVAAPQAQQDQTANPAQPYRDATQAATAAVAAAMAKLKPQGATPQGQAKTEGETAIQNLTQKVADMRTDDRIRHSKQPGTGGYAAGHRGGRAPRRGAPRDQHGTVEVPGTDFDFQSSNAKFNKQDLVKEAIATGSPLGTPAEEGEPSFNGTNGAVENETVVIPTAPYNKSSSFFDNISSELKDREDAKGRLGGHEFRTEERRKNLETFGQGSVDNYRGGFRGRGRGRGFRGGRGYGRGRGGGGRGRGAAQTAEAGAA